MNIQTSLLISDNQLLQQKKFLKELMELKAEEIRRKEFNNVYGTSEEIKQKVIEVEQMIENYQLKVTKTFSSII